MLLSDERDKEGQMETKIHQENDETEDNVIYGHLMDSPTSQLDDVLNKKLEQALDQPTSQFVLHDIAKIAIEHDPIDLAYAASRLPPQARVIVFENLPDLNAKIIFITNTGSHTRSVIFSQLHDQEMKLLLERMPPDEAVWLLDDISDRRLKRVLEILDPKKALRIREIYKHDRHSAGRLMTDEFFAFHLNTKIKEVAAVIRDNPGIDLTRRIFVLNDADELVGFVPARNLIINPFDVPIKQIMRPVLHQIRADASRDEVVDIVERYKIPALPVVDEKDRLVGVITYEAVVEAMEDIADETIANIAGTSEDVSDEPILQRFTGRAPWLIVTLFAGLVTATVLAYFKDRDWFTFVALFVPLIAGMSGNVGIQCSTILVRGMSTGELSYGSRRKAVIGELSIGLLIGVIFGLICGLVVYFFNISNIHQGGVNPFILGLIVSCGLLGACLMATLLGTLSPFFFARFRIDPAVASGPIVTAFNDVLSTLMYIFIAKVISSFFII
jgi:magnesium transporter